MQPNVLFIVVDALRADHTSVHGYERPTTPALEALAADGYAFDGAFAAAPWTPPSHASMFSGVYPSTHGYFEGGMSFSIPHRSLAERLRDEGYRTFGAVRNGHIDSRQEVTAGFDEYGDIYRLPRLPRSLSEIRSLYLDLLPGYARVAARSLRADRRLSEYVTCEYVRTRIADGETPFFGFINVNSPHSPYAPPEPFRSRFETFDRDDVDLDLIRSLSDVEGNGLKRYVAGEIDPPQEVWDAVQDWYDGEVRFADSLVERLVDTLRATGRYDETLIVVTGDHGEHFGEHGRAFHQFSLFDELLHVPLIVKPPAAGTSGPRDTDGLVSHVDLYPTILSELGFSVPETVDGRPLFDSEPRDAVFAEYGLPSTAISGLENNVESPLSDAVRDELEHSLQCVRTEDRKYVRRHGGTDRVYAVGTGSPKDTPLPLDDGDDLARLLRRELETELDVSGGGAIDDETRSNLKELGYL